jgi:TonB family protein
MTHRTRPARTPLMLCLAAFALTHACAFAPRLHALQDPTPPVQVRAAPDPSAYLGPVGKEWLLYALRAREADEAALVRLVQRRGFDTYPTADDEKELRAAGATDRLIEAVRKHVATPTPPAGGFGTGSGTGLSGNYGSGDRGGGGPGSPGTTDYTRPFRQSEVTRKALITFKPEPGFTEDARKNGVEGVVRLRAVLNASGGVTNISVVKGLPDGLTEKAIAAARQIRFTPAQKDGRAVSQYVVLEYNFVAFFDEGEVDERAIILEKPDALYTEEARRNNVRGKVVLKVTLTSFGGVAVDSVEAGLPHGLTEKAVEAAQRIKFEPARRGGRHVSQSTTVEYQFTP